jgi:hypothetical protein
LVLLGLRGQTIDCVKVDDDNSSTETTVLIDDIDPKQLQVKHFYGLGDVHYFGIRKLAWGLTTRWPYAWLWLRQARDAVAQRLFNRRTLEVRRRLDILREVVEASVEGVDGVDAMALIDRRYGYRWAGHPDWADIHQVLERHLQLLAETGDLRKFDHGYRPTGQALKTLDESEEADRKHSANLRVQLLLAALTFVSAVMAAAQAGLVKLPTLVDLRGKATVAAEAGQATDARAPTAASGVTAAGR